MSGVDEALEARLGEARRRRLAARGGAEWTRARAEELAIEEALFGIGGVHVTFNPNQHPRDRIGKFANLLGGLKHGDTAHLPGGVAVTRTRAGYKVRHQKELMPDLGRVDLADARAAAAHAISIDPTPRENHRIEGVGHREGERLSRRDVHRLAAGTPVVAKGEYGKFVGIEHEGPVVRAVVEFDHPREGRKIRKRVSVGGLKLAHRVEDPEGAHTTEEPYSPGRTLGTLMSLNPGGDAFHAMHYFTERAVEERPDERARRLHLERLDRELAAMRLPDAQLRRSGIVTSTG